MVLGVYGFAQVPPGKQPAAIQTSNGASSPNISVVNGNVTVQYGVDAKAFETAVRRQITIEEALARVKAERDSIQKQLATEKQLSTQERLRLENTLIEKQSDLGLKTAELLEVNALNHQLAEALKLSDQSQAATLLRLRDEERRATALELTAAAASLDANPAEYRRAVALSLQAISKDFSYTTASAALNKLLSLPGPPVGDDAYAWFSADGAKIVAVTRAHRLHLWDVTSGRLLRSAEGNAPLEPNAGSLKAPGSDVIVTFTLSGEVTVWSASTLESLTVLQVPGISKNGTWKKAISGDGSVLVETFQPSFSDIPTPINTWDLKTGRKVGTLLPRAGGLLQYLAISEHGTMVASVVESKLLRSTVTVWKVGTSKPFRSYSTSGVDHVLGGSGDQIFGIVRGEDGKEIWDLTTGKRIQAIELPDTAVAEEYHIGLIYPNFLASVSTNGVWLRRVGDNRDLFHLPVAPSSLGIDPTGRFAVISFGPRTVLVNLGSQEFYDLDGDAVFSPHFSPSGDLVVGSTKTGLTAWRTADTAPIWNRRFRHSNFSSAFAHQGSVAQVQASLPFTTWDLEYAGQWTVLRSESNKEFRSATFSSDGRFILQCDFRSSCQVSDYRSMTVVGTYNGINSSGNYSFVADDGRRILLIVSSGAANDPPELMILTDSALSPKTVLPLRSSLAAIAATGDFRFVAIAYGDGTLELINCVTGARDSILGTRAKISTLDISADGKLLAGGAEDGSIELWDMPARTMRRAFQLPKPINLVRLSREGRILAVGAGPQDGISRGIVKLWDTEQSEPIIEFPMFSSVRALGFSEDERSIMADDGQGPVQAPFSRESLGRALCGLLVPAPNSGFAQDAEALVKDICTTFGPK